MTTLSVSDRTTCDTCDETFAYNDCYVVTTNDAPDFPIVAKTVLQKPPLVKPAPRPQRPSGVKGWLWTPPPPPPPPPLPPIRSRTYPNPDPKSSERIDGTEALVELACPRCKEPLTPVKKYRIALIGSSASGKSHYIASLVDQVINKGTLAGFQCTPHARGRSQALYEQNYFAPLILRKEAIEPNKAGDVKNAPLEFTVVLWRSDSSFRREFTFVLFDWEGEALGDESRRVMETKYINRAAAMIFFIDPLSMPGVVRHLPTHLRELASDNRSQVGNMISTVVVNHNRKQGWDDTKPLGVPVAITLAKSDLVATPCEVLGMSPRFLQDERYVDGYDPNAARAVSREVRDFLVAVGAHDALSREGLLANVSYHAVSATGFEEIDGHYEAYRPTRCLDPFLWILHQLHLLDER